jgi:hypothetical protein
MKEASQATGSSQRPVLLAIRAIISLANQTPLLVVLAWAILYAERPLQLGIFSDDWWALIEPTQGTAPFSPDRFAQFVGFQTTFSARPVAGLANFLMSSIAGRSPVAHQICSIVLVLIAALSLRAWLSKLKLFGDQSSTIPADLATIFWLSIPWSLPITGWPVMAYIALPAQIFFTEAARLAFRKKPLRLRTLPWIGTLLLLSYLTYESFYLQFLYLAIFYLVFYRQRFANKTCMFWFLATVITPQAIGIGFNRYVSHVNSAVSKRFAPHWADIFPQFFQAAPGELSLILGSFAKVWTILIVILVGVSLLAIGLGLVHAKKRCAAAELAGLLIFSVVAVATTTVIYSVASYRISFLGNMGRTAFCVSLALSIAFFTLVSTAALFESRALRAVVLAVGAAIILIDCVPLHTQVARWAFVWSEEKRVLQNTPTDQLVKLPVGSSVLFIGPSYYHDVVIFGASWDITAAVSSLPVLSHGKKPYQGMTDIHPATDMYNWSWDGKTLVQELPQYWVLKFPAAHLYVWNFEQRKVFEATPGYVRCVVSPLGVRLPPSDAMP